MGATGSEPIQTNNSPTEENDLPMCLNSDLEACYSKIEAEISETESFLYDDSLIKLYSKLSKIAFDIPVDIDKCYVENKMTANTISLFSNQHSIELKTVALEYLINVFSHKNINITDEFISNKLLEKLENNLNFSTNEIIIMYTFRCISCIASQCIEARDYVVDVFPFEKLHEIFKQMKRKEKIRKQIIKVIEAFSFFPFDYNSFSRCTSFIEDSDVVSMFPKQFSRCVLALSLNNKADLLIEHNSIINPIISLLDSEDNQIALTALRILCTLSLNCEERVLQIDLSKIFKFVESEDKSTSICAMQTIGNTVINNATNFEVVYEEENVEKVYNKIVESIGVVRCEAVMLAATMIRCATSRHVYDMCKYQFIAEFVEAIDTGRVELIDSILSALSVILKHDTANGESSALSKFEEAGGREKIDELCFNSEDENIAEKAQLFKSICLKEKTKKKVFQFHLSPIR